MFKAVLAGDKSTFSVTVAVAAGAVTLEDTDEGVERFSVVASGTRGGVVIVRDTSDGGGTLRRWLLELGVVFTVVWMEEALE